MTKKKKTLKKYKCDGKTKEEMFIDLYQACREGKLDVIKILVERGEINVTEISPIENSCQGLTVSHIAARYNQAECLEYILSKGGDMDAVDAFGFRPIHDAALRGHADCISVLLARKADTTGVKERDLDFLTPLHYAMRHNHTDCINLLKEETDAINQELIWDIASKRGNASLTDLTKKDDLSKLHFQDWLHNAAICGHVTYFDKLKGLISRKFGSIETVQSLIPATQHGQKEYLQKLLEAGLDPNTSTTDGATALHYAARYGFEECIELLVKHGADVNITTHNNWSPLHIAIRQCCVEGVKTLIKCGCDINQTGGEVNDTPVHIAVKLPTDEATLKAVLEGNPTLAIKNDEGKLPTDIVSEFEPLNQLVLEYARN